MGKLLRGGVCNWNSENPGAACICHQGGHLEGFEDALGSRPTRTGAKYGRGRSLYRQTPMLGVRGMRIE